MGEAASSRPTTQQQLASTESASLSSSAVGILLPRACCRGPPRRTALVLQPSGSWVNERSIEASFLGEGLYVWLSSSRRFRSPSNRLGSPTRQDTLIGHGAPLSVEVRLQAPATTAGDSSLLFVPHAADEHWRSKGLSTGRHMGGAAAAALGCDAGGRLTLCAAPSLCGRRCGGCAMGHRGGPPPLLCGKGAAKYGRARAVVVPASDSDDDPIPPV